MPYAQSTGARLYYEETGTGYPVIFVHEYGADHREWEHQVRFFSRDYRCIAYAARGYPPSDVPDDPKLYGQDHSADDIVAVLRHLGIARAHVVGLSMGAFATLRCGLRHPEAASALVVAGCGSGSNLAQLADWRRLQAETSARLAKEGWAALAEETGHSPTRIQLKKKDPRAWNEFMEHLRGHSAKGSALTQRWYQGERDPVYHWEAQLKEMTVPTLVVVGDEDEPCVEPSVFLKRTLPKAGLWMCPRTGHAINLEEPAAFNREVAAFFAAVERGRWPA
ncbi:MAG TPA: alpha/beta hydrolase [Burkholderiales bacterium]|nr:alpha/beta hydrolase [Burkholderiales bacterium]